MKSKIILSIILVNYKTGEMTSEAIQALKTSFKNVSFEVIVVDNNSNDNSVEFIQNKHPDITVIREKENHGYGKAVNKGVKISNGQYLLILNSDIIIVKDYLKYLINFYKKNNAGILGIKLLLPDGEFQKTFGYFPSPMLIISNEISLLRKINKKHFKKYALIKSDNPKTQEVDWVTGAFMFISKENYERVNGFDDNIFMYYEDVDICRKIRDMGFPTFFISEYYAIHKHCATAKRTKQANYNFLKVKEKESALYYIKKYYQKYLILVKLFLFLIFIYKYLLQGLKYFVFVKTEKAAKNKRKLETYKQYIKIILMSHQP